MNIKYMNAAQMQVLSSALGDIWDKLEQYGHLVGGGLMQEKDGEIYIYAHYLIGTIVGVPPEKIKGFRIHCEERAGATM